MHAIAAELAAHHDTVLVEGGFPVPRPAGAADAQRLILPALVPADDAVARARVERLEAGAAALRPDVVVVEHYPFSKWELETEIEALIAAARDANPRVHVVASLRDIPPRARHLVETPDYDVRVLDRLARSFDALFVHTDARVLPWEEHFPAADRLPVPCSSTGVVVGPAATPVATERPFAVATADGPEAIPFLLAVVEAFGVVAMPVRVFTPVDASAADVDALRDAAVAHDGATVHEFATDYGAWLAGAAASVSRGGYNTLAELARDRVPAVVVPEPRTDDQVPRAAAFARAGACDVVEGPLPTRGALADAIARVVDRDRPAPTIDLTGATTTRQILESLVAG
jgi:predicted glycosyltransferase